MAIRPALSLVGMNVFFTYEHEAVIGLTTVAYHKFAESGRQDFIRGKQDERMAKKSSHLRIKLKNGIAAYPMNLILALSAILADKIMQLGAGIKKGG